EPGPVHADPMPDAPPPETIGRSSDRPTQILGEVPAEVYEVPARAYEHPIDLRSIDPLSGEPGRDPSLRTTRNLVWLRVNGELPEDPLLHVCLMTYVSDMTLLDSVLNRHGLSFADGR